MTDKKHENCATCDGVDISDLRKDAYRIYEIATEKGSPTYSLELLSNVLGVLISISVKQKSDIPVLVKGLTEDIEMIAIKNIEKDEAEHEKKATIDKFVDFLLEDMKKNMKA